MSNRNKREVRDNMSYLDHVKKQHQRGSINADTAEFSEYLFTCDDSIGKNAPRYKLWSGVRDSPDMSKIFPHENNLLIT